MTYTNTLPLTTDKIRNFPGDVSTNQWPRINTVVSADHQFNASAATNDGYHKVVHWIRQAGAFNDGTPAASALNNIGLTYTKRQSNGAATPTYREALFFKNGTASAADDGSVIETQLTAAPIRAMIVFPGATPLVPTFAFNATAATTGTGLYTITMGAGTVPSANYGIFVTGNRNASGTSGLTYSVRNQTVPTTTSFQIQCSDGSGNLENPLTVMIMVVGG
jgi:hypothetical protein